MNNQCGFNSFFLGGFESSCHFLKNGRRLDLIAATQHDIHAERDYELLKDIGIHTSRDAIRWHRIEKQPYQYDWSSALPMIRAGRRVGMQVIWDLCHYGWPDDLDVFQPEFVRRFSAFARAAAALILAESDGIPYFTPINEISFLAWGGGDHAFLNPYAEGRGTELKCQLARATIAAIDAIRELAPHARFVQIDPLINVVADSSMTLEKRQAAEGYNRAQFDGYEMVTGKIWPQLGGRPEYLDIVGANYYVHNQWVLDGKFIEPTDHRYRPLNQLLGDLYRRYSRPLFLAETGIEGERRPEWLAYVCDEVARAIGDGIPVQGICLYPIMNHPGWLDERHCHNGLFDYCNESGLREIYKPLADELRRQISRFEAILSRIQARREGDFQGAMLHSGETGAGLRF